jgi:DNA repair exonuclease SbcCD ATPase subunit
MPHPQRHKKAIKSDFSEVVAFASRLDELIKARTSENKLFQAAKVGKSKLGKYLDGTDMPDRRVLEHYILTPLAAFAPLREDEYEELVGLYEEACVVCRPKPPTAADQIAFLEEDLTQERERVAELTQRLNEALDKNLESGREKEQIEQGHKDLRALLTVMTAQVRSLEEELERAKEEQQTSLEDAGQKLAEFAEQKRQELETCQERISDLELAVSHYARTSDDLRQDMDQTLLRLQSLHKQNAFLRKKAAEERMLFMKLVVHARGGEVLRRELYRLHRRLEQSEQTIARLTETTRNLTVANQNLMADLDRVTQERDFLRAAPAYYTSLPDSSSPTPGLFGMWTEIMSPDGH